MNCLECGKENVKIIFGRIYLCPKCDSLPDYLSAPCPRKTNWRTSLWETSDEFSYADTYWSGNEQVRVVANIPGNGQTRTLHARTPGGKRILIEWGDIQVTYNIRNYSVQHIQLFFEKALQRLLTDYLIENDRIQINLDFEQLQIALARENIRFEANDNNGRAMLRTSRSSVRNEIYIQISNLQVSIE